jgi:recombination protein RecR
MGDIAEPVERLIANFKKLPGIGSKSAQRMAFHILKMDTSEAEQLAAAIVDMKHTIRHCSTCGNLTDVDQCHFCTHPGRSDRSLCIVEESHNILPIENTHEFNGRYHVLMGAISPLKGVGPDQLNIKPLLERLEGGSIEEIIVATNPNVEGETTALYLSKLIKPLGIRVTRLAMGLPMGGDLDYADSVTMSKALEGRREL